MHQYERACSIADEVVQALRAGIGEQLESVVLFGSRARNEARPGSDWDFLVIAEGLPEHVFERHLFVKQLLPPSCRGAVSILARTRAEFEGRLPSLYLDIGLDGQVLFDPHGYASERLAALRQIIEEAGLHRVCTPAGDVWRWDQQPDHPWVLEWKR